MPRLPDAADDGGAVLKHWEDSLTAYLDGQGELIDAVRAQSRQPERPFPDNDNPMAGYLIDRAEELVHEHGLRKALVWLAVHAWYEGAIEERADLIRHVAG